MDYKEVYDAGKKYGELCGHSWHLAMYYDNPYTTEKMMQWDYAAHRFYEAGFAGEDWPEMVQAIRYGDIPKNGQSINWAENRYECGVSCVKIVRQPEDLSYSSVYDVTLCDREKYLIEGYYFHDTGSDGEPLLVNAKMIKRLEI